MGNNNDPGIVVVADAFKNTLRVRISNISAKAISIKIRDNSYGLPSFNVNAEAGKTVASYIDPIKSSGWYDISLTVEGNDAFMQSFAGRLENGKPGKTDPLMGREMH